MKALAAGLALSIACATVAHAAPPPGMRLVPAGTFRMGSANGLPDEAPPHDVTVAAFWIDETEVTVRAFAAFVDATGYRTESERLGWSAVFDRATGGFVRKDGATWRAPEGPGSTAAPDEPVTQVSWDDASAYARWAGKRLPTEAEWERAARGGLEGRTFAWGDALRPDGRSVANWWQGTFPTDDTGEDGFRGRAPVARFAPNGYGLYDVTGNVWEWCADWYDPNAYRRDRASDPRGPTSGTERVLRGGSFLCAENACTRYRVAGRSRATPDSALDNTGFRCAQD